MVGFSLLMQRFPETAVMEVLQLKPVLLCFSIAMGGTWQNIFTVSLQQKQSSMQAFEAFASCFLLGGVL